MNLTNFSDLRDLLKKYGVWAKKRLGQNFLVDAEVLAQIIAAAEIELGETIVEIGPGPGVLTQALLRAGAKVEAVELDTDILPVLKEAARAYKGFLTIYNTHVLSFNPPEGNYKLVANIPYYLTSPILRKFLNEVSNRPTRVVLLVQKEVAEKICEPAGRDSHLSLMVKAYGAPKIVALVKAESFYPVPKVDSAILQIDLFSQPLFSLPPKIFEEMLFAGFAEPRKKLGNVLSRKFSMPATEIRTILEKNGISPDLRAQNLSIPEWEKLAKVFLAKYL